MTKIKSRGFSLVELLITCAILSILAAIAFPNYQDYAIRAKMSEALTLMSGAKASVTEYRLSRNVWPSNNQEAGLAQPASIQGTSVKSVQIDGSVIIASIRSISAPGGGKIVLKGINSGDSVLWRCDSSAGTTLQAKFLPPECR